MSGIYSLVGAPTRRLSFASAMQAVAGGGACSRVGGSDFDFFVVADADGSLVYRDALGGHVVHFVPTVDDITADDWQEYRAAAGPAPRHDHVHDDGGAWLGELAKSAQGADQ